MDELEVMMVCDMYMGVDEVIDFGLIDYVL